MSKEEFPLVVVAIMNFKSYDDVIENLESLKKSHYPNFKIAVVDTASPDDSYARLETAQKERGDFTLLQTGWDGGFASGVNLALKWAFKEGAAAYACFLDSDIIVEPQHLSALVQTAQKDKKIGVVASKYLYYYRPGILQNAGGTYLPWLGYPWAHGCNKKDGPAYNKEREVDWGCALLVSREAADKSGGMREDYFHYIDDMEWPVRIKRNGFRVVFQPKVRLYHKVSGTHKGDSVRPYYYERRNCLYCLLDHFEIASLLGISARVSKMFIDALLSPFTGQKYMPRLVGRILGDVLKNKRGKADLSEFNKVLTARRSMAEAKEKQRLPKV